MRPAMCACHFSTNHAVTAILFCDDSSGNRIGKTWPARTGMEFRLRHEELGSAGCASIDPWIVIINVNTGTGRFGPALKHDAILLGSELLLEVFEIWLRHMRDGDQRTEIRDTSDSVLRSPFSDLFFKYDKLPIPDASRNTADDILPRHRTDRRVQ
jgi:hypothetical protein